MFWRTTIEADAEMTAAARVNTVEKRMMNGLRLNESSNENSKFMEEEPRGKLSDAAGFYIPA